MAGDQPDSGSATDGLIPCDTDFRVDDVVLAFHGGLLYEARVLNVEQERGNRAHAYTVHFQGWRKSWDERVLASMIYEHNDDNLRVAHRLLHGAKMRQQAAQPTDTEKETKQSVEKALPASSPPTAMFQIPPALQRQLVDDWEFITKENRLVPLPRETNVQQILQKWVMGKRQSSDKATREVSEGLQYYFDASLPKLLLYRFERQQYIEMFQKPKSDSMRVPSQVYGPEHLLRLLLKLPYLLETSAVEHDKMQAIADKVNDLAKYMQRNGRLLFLTEYEQASQKYINSVLQQSL